MLAEEREGEKVGVCVWCGAETRGRLHGVPHVEAGCMVQAPGKWQCRKLLAAGFSCDVNKPLHTLPVALVVSVACFLIAHVSSMDPGLGGCGVNISRTPSAPEELPSWAITVHVVAYAFVLLAPAILLCAYYCGRRTVKWHRRRRSIDSSTCVSIEASQCSSVAAVSSAPVPNGLSGQYADKGSSGQSNGMRAGGVGCATHELSIITPCAEKCSASTEASGCPSTPGSGQSTRGQPATARGPMFVFVIDRVRRMLPRNVRRLMRSRKLSVAAVSANIARRLDQAQRSGRVQRVLVNGTAFCIGWLGLFVGITPVLANIVLGRKGHFLGCVPLRADRGPCPTRLAAT